MTPTNTKKSKLRNTDIAGPSEMPHAAARKAILDQVAQRISELAWAAVPRSSMARPEATNISPCEWLLTSASDDL